MLDKFGDDLPHHQGSVFIPNTLSMTRFQIANNDPLVEQFNILQIEFIFNAVEQRKRKEKTS